MRSPRYVRSRHVVCHWQGGSLVLENYATGTRLPATSVHALIADACSQPRTLREIKAQHHLNVDRCDQVLRQLIEARILYAEGDAQPACEQAMRGFAAWNPAAGYFHTATKYVNFGVPIRRDLSGGSKDREGAACTPVQLPHAAATGEFADVLLARRTWRRFSRRKVALDRLSQLLRLTAGVHHWLDLKDGTTAAMRTSPSGGARHPIDLFVVSLRVRGLAAGRYAYDGESHTLRPLAHGVGAGRVERYLPGQPWYQDAAALVLFSATFARTRQRYDYARAYRAVMIEAGHLCQTFCLTATWLGLAPFCSLALADDAIERDFGIDGISQSVVYAAGVGSRAAAEHECMVPAGAPAPPARRNPVFARSEGMAKVGAPSGRRARRSALR